MMGGNFNGICFFFRVCNKFFTYFLNLSFCVIVRLIDCDSHVCFSAVTIRVKS